MADSFLQEMIKNNPRLAKISILGLSEVFGGVLLLFVLGIQAWTQTDVGRAYRRRAGALTVGVILGYVFYAVYPKVLSSLIDRSARGWIAFAGLPILLLAFTFFLESLRKNLGKPGP